MKRMKCNDNFNSMHTTCFLFLNGSLLLACQSAVCILWRSFDENAGQPGNVFWDPPRHGDCHFDEEVVINRKSKARMIGIEWNKDRMKDEE
jgi:hypothetical protein